MAKLGEIRINGVSVPYYDVGDVQNNWIRVREGNGPTGALNLVARADADRKQLTFEAPNGSLWAPRSVLSEIFDDFNDGTAGNTVGSPWTFTSGSQTYETVAAYEGPLGLRCYSGACDSFGSTVPYYPQWGDKVEHYWRSTTGDTYMNTYLFATKDANANITNGYRFGHYVANNYVYLERIKSGTGTNLYRDLATAQSQDTWYHDEMHFLDQASEKIRWVIRDVTNGTLVHDITVTPTSPNSVAANTGVRLSIDSTKTGYYDYVNIVPGGATA